ncbi:F-box/LRR-repeat protein 5-like [Pollicipes pollicipes]|uniref:F-box/LRR-repeat protein 5-like n=1 Tax=Pollicipes pollicipes TaxID=41117 RepID=UPI001884C3D6|nr:F-box/LRR-repeat protein 5-like [Pollicipes pollicipes]
MSPRFPVELDVFTVPHSRMKHLVKMYSNQLSATDFSSSRAVAALLSSLLVTFREFRCHEQIENQLIVGRLKRRLSVRSAHHATVCSCHEDNRLTEMLELLETNVAEECWSAPGRDAFLLRLRRALDDFTDRFVPHMEEEERVFQPLLMEYFDYNELRELKQHVLLDHSLAEKADLPEKPAEPLPDLPSEVLTHVLSFLGPPDRAAAAAVCRRWREAALAPPLWRSLYPALWARGVWDPSQVDVVDELLTRSELRRAALTNQTLPLVGRHVHWLELTGSRCLDSRQLRRLLSRCPNVRRLDVSYTNIGDAAFKSLPAGALRCLEHVNLSGCERLTDRGLARMASQLSPAALLTDQLFDSGDDSARQHDSCSSACPSDSDSDSGRAAAAAAAVARLRYLSLSGCWRVTSVGARCLAACPAVAGLRHLDAPGLPPAALWYCDMVADGPHPLQANGCDNLECPVRRCCQN